MSAAVKAWGFEDFDKGAQIVSKGRTVTEADISMSVSIIGQSA